MPTKQTSRAIRSFSGDYHFLSNSYHVDILLDGEWYPTVEHAYQAAKTNDPGERDKIRKEKTSSGAKNCGRGVQLRDGWMDNLRVQIMTELVRQKFTSHRELGALLLETGDAELIEGNAYGDVFWGRIFQNGSWVGKNMLGIILMQIREELENE